MDRQGQEDDDDEDDAVDGEEMEQEEVKENFKPCKEVVKGRNAGEGEKA